MYLLLHGPQQCLWDCQAQSAAKQQRRSYDTDSPVLLECEPCCLLSPLLLAANETPGHAGAPQESQLEIKCKGEYNRSPRENEKRMPL